MASEQSPLLDAQAPSSTGEQPSASPRRWLRVREAALFLWALLATAAVIVLAVWVQHMQQARAGDHAPPSTSPKRNLIFMVSDGMGPASLSLTRSFRQHIHGLPPGDVLTLDKHFWGTSRTRSSNSLVTDSAAGATAFSCGKKSYNGAISVTPDYEPCGTVMEAAKLAGYLTGLVVTTDITDATPACFASHALLRQMEDDIARQEIGEGPLGRVVDLMLGGGRCHFLPNSSDESCRIDDFDVLQKARSSHWSYIDNREGFDALNHGEDVNLPFLGLFARHKMPFEIDRRNQNNVYPSLSEMATTALRALEKATSDSEKGFFLMIEGSRIDHAGHGNDPATQVHEVLEYDKTFQAVVDFIKKSDTDTLLIATSDHETGGLATAIQEPGHDPVYNWYPQVLANATASCEHLGSKLRNHLHAASSDEELKAWINMELVVAGLGVADASAEELSAVAADPEKAHEALAAIISRRAHVGWSTHGHTAVDVNIYSSGGSVADSIRGNVENTEVGLFMQRYLDVDPSEITQSLKGKMQLFEGQHQGDGIGNLDVATLAQAIPVQESDEAYHPREIFSR